MTEVPSELNQHVNQQCVTDSDMACLEIVQKMCVSLLYFTNLPVVAKFRATVMTHSHRGGTQLLGKLSCRTESGRIRLNWVIMTLDNVNSYYAQPKIVNSSSAECKRNMS